MADIDLKALTPDTSIDANAFLFGADSQSATSPSIYSVSIVKSAIIGAGDISVASGKTLTANNTLTLSGADGSALNVGSGGTLGALATVSAGTGVATAASNAVNGAGGLVTSATFTAASGKTLTASNSLTLAGTDGTTMTFPSTSATLARTDAGNTFTGSQTISSGSLIMSGNISSAAWTTNGIRFRGVAATLTDTTSTGTVSAAYTNVYGGNTIAASNTATFTDYFTTFITEPTAGTNVTFTNKWALGLSGNLKVTGNVTVTGALTATNMANGRSLGRFTPLDNQPPASNFATLDTRNSVATLDFDDTTDESAVFVGVIPQGATLTSGIKVRIFWAATTATSGDCRWGAQFEKYGTDIDADSFDTATYAATTTSGTSGIVVVTEITCTSIDSLAAGDQLRLKIIRSASNGADTMTGDAELIAVELQQVA